MANNNNDQQGNAVALQPSRIELPRAVAKEYELDASQWRVLVQQIFPSAKSAESVLMALAYCRQRKLDIFKKPVHIVPIYDSKKREYVETVWPGISEIRTTAARTGEYAGQDEVEFGSMIEREFEAEFDEWENRKKIGTRVERKTVRYPEWAKVTVYRITQGGRYGYTAKVYWEETYASIGKSDMPNEMWSRRARGQLEKCAEAAALRKAFPEELGNTYSAEEMYGQSFDSGPVIEHKDEPPAAPPPPPPSAPPPPPQEGEGTGGNTIDHDPDERSSEFDVSDWLEWLETNLMAQTGADHVETIWQESNVDETLRANRCVDWIENAWQIKERALARHENLAAG